MSNSTNTAAFDLGRIIRGLETASARIRRQVAAGYRDQASWELRHANPDPLPHAKVVETSPDDDEFVVTGFSDPLSEVNQDE